MSSSKISELNKEQITKLASKIIADKKLSDQIPIPNIAYDVVDNLKDQYSGYTVRVFDADLDEDCYYVSKASAKKQSLDDMSFEDILMFKPDEPMVGDALIISENHRKLLEEILVQLGIIHPAKYKKILQELGIQELKEPPSFSYSKIESWAQKIISYYKLTKSTDKTTIIKHLITFYDIMFTDYSISYVLFRNKEKVPAYIKRKFGNDFMFIDSIDLIRKIVNFTYYLILQKLNRKEDFPKDPDFWFDFVIIYEDLGFPQKASEFGDIGLSCNSQELGGLVELVTYYSEKKTFQKAVKYLKKVGQIYFNQKQYPPALQAWEAVNRFEPTDKENLFNLAKIYRAMGNETKAKDAESRAKRL